MVPARASHGRAEQEVANGPRPRGRIHSSTAAFFAGPPRRAEIRAASVCTAGTSSQLAGLRRPLHMPPLDATTSRAVPLLGADGAVIPVSDQDIFRELYPGLRRFARACADRDIDPDDLIQSALARCLARKTLAELDDPGAYLRAAVVRQVSDERRRLQRRRKSIVRLLRAEGSRDSYPSDVDFLDELNPFDRSILYLIHVEGWSVDQLADVFHTSAQAIRARASRARKVLRERLTELELDDA